MSKRCVRVLLTLVVAPLDVCGLNITAVELAPPPWSGKLLHLLRNSDTNRNGVLSASEFQIFLANVGASGIDAPNTFYEADLDGDKELSLPELTIAVQEDAQLNRIVKQRLENGALADVPGFASVPAVCISLTHQFCVRAQKIMYATVCVALRPIYPHLSANPPPTSRKSSLLPWRWTSSSESARASPP